MREAGWSGMMSLPRVMNLDTDGSLRLNVLPDSKHLREGVIPTQQSLTGVSTLLKAASGEVICSGTKGRSFEMTMVNNSVELLHISYSGVEHRFDVAGHEIALEPTDVPKIHIFVDGSVIESIVSERVGYTSRFYYSAKTTPDIKASVKAEGKIAAWKISPITGDRLATLASDVWQSTWRTLLNRYLVKAATEGALGGRHCQLTALRDILSWERCGSCAGLGRGHFPPDRE